MPAGFSEAKIRFLTNHDTLTGLLNRNGLYDVLSEWVDEFTVWGREPVLVLVDLDGFRAVNSSNGHDVGDEILRIAGERLAEIVGATNPVGRLNGDEFVILVDGADRVQSAIQVAKDALERLAEPFDIGDRAFELSASCGIAYASTVSGNVDALVLAVDLAINRAKRLGAGSIVIFEPQHLEEEEERRRFEEDLRLAVNGYEFSVCYQPLFDMSTREIVAFEALLRWPHEMRGNISPEVFVPVAEKTGLIVKLGEWVLREACREATNWPEHIRIAVNLSPLQFCNPKLLPTLVEILEETGLTPGRLELEITESALLGAEDRNISILNAFHDLGVRVAIDDFGTGYSSLAYLQSFRFDKIKIDKRFVQNVGADHSTAAIIHTIIGLSKRIGIKTTGEGIETEQQFLALGELGCSEAQGFLLSQPLSARRVKNLLS